MGYARTNGGSFGSQSGSGGSNSSTLPTILKSLTAAAGNNKITVSWQYANTSYLKGIRICWSTGAINTPSDNYAHVDIDNTTTTSYTITGLTNNTRYYIRVFPYNNDKNYQTSITNATVNTVPTAIVVTAGTAGVQMLTNPNGCGYNIARITSSGTFTITASAATTIKVALIGGGKDGNNGQYYTGQYMTGIEGGSGGQGGYASLLSLSTTNGTISCSATIASRESTAGTTLKYGSTSYSANSSSSSYGAGGSAGNHITGRDISPVIHPGGNGGLSSVSSSIPYFACSGGGGGGGAYDQPGGLGANGAGSGATPSKNSSNSGASATGIGCGGGGGACYYSHDTAGSGGYGSAGGIIIFWPV